ncbi:MAG: MFS transporter [Deltaproteobacteria bacterium]|nr:MFS transporter [Candidatus Zymogenaceae bacterium]
MKDPDGARTLTVGGKLGYGVGDFAFNLAYQTTALYLLIFFTDTFLINAAAAGTIMLVSKLWDAISDPMMGHISDRTRSRWGSKRPYLLFGAIPLGLAVCALFYGPDIESHALRVVYALVVFVLFCTIITINNVPYSALTANLTQDTDERSVLTGYRMSFAIFGALIAAGATLPLVGLFGGEDKLIGFRMTGILYGAVVAAVILITFASVKERGGQETTEHMTVKESLKVIGGNKPLIILFFGTSINLTAVLTTAAVVNYYFKYNLNNESMIPVAFLCLFVTAILFMPFSVYLTKKIGKKITYNLGMLSFAGVLVLLFFFGEINVYLTLFLFFLGAFGMATNWLCPWAMVPDTVEYSEWKQGLRREGVIYGAFFFGQKYPAALAMFISGIVLNFVGYIPNIEQTDQSLMGIRVLLTLIPAALLVIGSIFIALFPINADMHRDMIRDIENRTDKT